MVPVTIPPLRERKDDVSVLARHFLEKLRERTNHRVQDLSELALSRLEEYDWPGNVRELENVMERAVSFCDGETITVEDLPEHVRVPGSPAAMGGTRSTAEQPAMTTARALGRNDEQFAAFQHLADRRLVVTGRDAAGVEVVEVVHESLIGSWGLLRGWIDEGIYTYTGRTWQGGHEAFYAQKCPVFLESSAGFGGISKQVL